MVVRPDRVLFWMSVDGDSLFPTVSSGGVCNPRAVGRPAWAVRSPTVVGTAEGDERGVLESQKHRLSWALCEQFFVIRKS